MEKVIKYMTVDKILYDSYERALEHEEYLKTNMKEAADKIKFYDENSKEIPVTVDTFTYGLGSFNDAYFSCDKAVILDTLSDTLQKYMTDEHFLTFPSAPGVYKISDDCKWELVK